jgi:radical SAM superfamily enzyme YgiQ (UPF0313 family)
MSEQDQLIDLALLSFKKRKEEVFKLIDDLISDLHPDDKVIVNAGDFPPDAAYNVYYDYFFNGMTFPYEAMGTYIKVHGDRLKKRFKFMSTIEELTHKPDYHSLNYNEYPTVDGKLRASIRASWGCPRRCAMCPVPTVFNNEYKYFDPINTANEIKKLYDQNVRYFTFIDDNLSADKQFIKLLLELRKLKLKGAKFHCQEGFDLGTFDIKRARLIKKLNFDDVKIAFESIIPALPTSSTNQVLTPFQFKRLSI